MQGRAFCDSVGYAAALMSSTLLQCNIALTLSFICVELICRPSPESSPNFV